MSDSDVNMHSILVAAADGNNRNNREEAEQQLRSLSARNFAVYLGKLCEILKSDNESHDVRQLAGIMLKQSLESHNEKQQEDLTRRWIEQQDNMKKAIKDILCSTMGSNERDVARTAGLCVAKIAAIDLPRGNWNDLLVFLRQSSHRSNPPSLRMATYDCLMFLCEDIPHYLSQNSADVLNIINLAIQDEEEDIDVKRVAAKCLANSIPVANENFKSQGERENVVRLVFMCCSNKDDKIRLQGYFALARIPEFYYEYLDPVIMDPAFQATTVAMLNDSNDDVSQQAVEFWCSVCERELENESNWISAQDDEWSQADKDAVLLPRHEIMKRAVGTLVPTLLLTMTKKSNFNEDVTCAAVHASFCLNLCSQCVRNEIIPHVIPFIQEFIGSNDWNKKEAAILAFGCIIDGPDEENVTKLLEAGLNPILSALTDDRPLVKDSAAWVLGQILHVHPESVPTAILGDIFQAILYGIKQSPKVARHMCWAIQGFADHVSTVMEEPSQSNKNSNALSPSFQPLLESVFWCSERSDGDKQEINDLIPSVYEAINHLMAAAAPDCYGIIIQALPALMGKLGTTLEKLSKITSSDDDSRHSLYDLQSIICGSLHVILQNRDLPATIFEGEAADSLMALFLKCLEVAARHAAVVEDAFACIGCIALRLETRFQRYLPALKDFLIAALKDSTQVRVLNTAIGLTSNLTHALKAIFMEISHDVMQKLLTHLQDVSVDRSVKPQVIFCIADIAMAIEGEFHIYLPWAMPLLLSAAEAVSAPLSNEAAMEDLEFYSILRESLLQAFVGILQGLGAKDAHRALLEWNQNAQGQGALPIIQFICELSKEKTSNLNAFILAFGCGFIEDFTNHFEANVVEAHLYRAEIKQFLLKAMQYDGNDKAGKAGDSARKKLEKKLNKKLM